MRSFVALTLAAAAVVQAIQITAPSNSSGWSTSGAQEIKWNSVSTDPSNFTITISLPESSDRSDITKENIQTSEGSWQYTPDSALEAGDGYRVSFVYDGAILAQSEQFSVTDGTSSLSATSSSSSSSTSASGTTTVSETGSTTASSSASATASDSAADRVTVGGGLLMLAGAFAMLI
ncbi:hypothetical protein L202_07905 [Cryptococcus amylolentus CBS 6039]|uniref:Yeast cell wall synthesis Kre9/Knh1-like N-terminal domain-containing protein n=2 Tax=Cryptococcus amylolentus TaxID=104669 RepID=A0A1E3HC68_9TREE|nr:hypothetical protein L202_07905 [Cryptococcus amylolentus CBS 6039]ODN73366.1 hypothetical protein L202_07905 [Cryptococcus amylolentus CBS 6039]ODN99154.1 hypothetical protein I350_07312 [Cryptococcus amylolentus CBS 6273]